MRNHRRPPQTYLLSISTPWRPPRVEMESQLVCKAAPFLTKPTTVSSSKRARARHGVRGLVPTTRGRATRELNAGMGGERALVSPGAYRLLWQGALRGQPVGERHCAISVRRVPEGGASVRRHQLLSGRITSGDLLQIQWILNTLNTKENYC